MQAVVYAADVQDRGVGVLVMAPLFGLCPFLLTPYADNGYAGRKFKAGLARACRQVNVAIVTRTDAGKIVERTIAWLNRCRRLAKDWKRFNSNALISLQWSCVRRMVKAMPEHPMIPDGHLNQQR